MIALYPGSFDPLTLGHMQIIQRASGLFDKVYVAVMVNKHKRGFLSKDVRLEMLRACALEYPNVEPLADDGLLKDLAARLKVSAVLRGVRGEADFAAEAPIADALRALWGIETVFIKADAGSAHISSSLVRELLSFDAPLDKLVPPKVLEMLKALS